MKKTNYNILSAEMTALLEDIDYEISILSNASSLLNMHIDEINWIGFYILKENKLILGPFQGKPACTIIPLNKGVCGHCASTQKTIIVDDVHNFSGHIACDNNSNSEICVPIFKNNYFYGLLDIDSPKFNRFDENDKINLEKITKIIENALNNIK